MFRTLRQHARASYRNGEPRRPASTAPFAAMLALLLALLYAVATPQHSGDVEEYALMTVALARHASPDIRPADIEATKVLLPPFADALSRLEQACAKGSEQCAPGFWRGRDGRVYAIHFFAYPALAALATKVVPLAGAPAFKAFLAVNLACVFVLGMALLRLFGSAARAMLGVLLFVLCGGLLYGAWSSPEMFSASALLAALALNASGAPLRVGLLAGLAATHNPPIVFFAVFAPLLRLCGAWRSGTGLAANVRTAVGMRELAGSLLTIAIFALSVLFNQWAFGVPSIIGKLATSAAMATPNRLFSLLFDLNQGMVVGVPGLFAVLLFGQRGRAACIAGVAVLFSMAMAVPALVAYNWNSGAQGMMRYAFWCAMPLLFAFLWRLRESARLPAAPLVVVATLQVVSIVHANAYNFVSMSPLAAFVMAHAPAAYNPDPEIFHERANGQESALDPQRIDSYAVHGTVVKRMFNVANLNAGTALCGQGQVLADDTPMTAADGGWRYINGRLSCVPAIDIEVGQAGLQLAGGWSHVEHGGALWSGVWSDGARARLAIALDPRQRPTRLVLHGRYHGANRRTRVSIDGTDLGWQALDQAPELVVPKAPDGAWLLSVELEFDAPNLPAPGQPDQRHIAFFLQKVTMH
ncbi:hypothetical protein NX773_01010 [Massilia solisilvae]|uniref:DUF2142 domain-containing protein n=1 Tax=Massilia solisilvae TaxID=1811225 RepID=A0ABT2BEC6_9BURK|nr:hypothetical protein [Massilia solisilvae]MCS0606742.1 hypothetical protein [Massilia solisilvae]